MNSGENAGIAVGRPPDNRRIAGVRGSLILLRGWCLEKIKAFKFQKAVRITFG